MQDTLLMDGVHLYGESSVDDMLTPKGLPPFPLPLPKSLLIPAAARIFSLDASFGLLATVSASALALFFGSALSSCRVSCML